MHWKDAYDSSFNKKAKRGDLYDEFWLLIDANAKTSSYDVNTPGVDYLGVIYEGPVASVYKHEGDDCKLIRLARLEEIEEYDDWTPAISKTDYDSSIFDQLTV